VNETVKVILLVIGAGGLACALIGLGSLVGRFLKANATVMSEPTPHQREWSFPVLGDVANPEHYPKTWAYRAERGAEETGPLTMGEVTGPLPLDETGPLQMWETTYVSNGDRTSRRQP
jgi:hypothetical protein